ncbi:uncharacterized protein LOC135699797 isoform X2 [Ochlerotatus camptorhynchus]|uniref:uncharacterized protein LOC135699797 isoform X2 n=1 Tax=Ochlerotatus camptorhynchus TaxID=644619 RepID=UPI0031CDB98A
MDLSMSSREDPFAPDSIFSQRDLPVVPNDNPESYCRLCLTTPDVVPLFPTGSDPNEFILELVGKYIGIGLTIQDDSPCSVCNSCQMILDQFDLFRQNCLKVDIAIRRRRLGLDRVVKSEPQDDDDMEVELPYIRLENRVYQCRICSEIFRSMALFMAHCKEEHPDEAKMYKCKHCSKSFMSKTARLQHIRSHRPSNSDSDFGGLRVQVCERCMVTFDSYKLLKIHIKEQHSNEPKQDSLVCNTCSRQFSRITILRNHILRVHMGKLPHVCKQCGISYGYAQQLVSHLKSEHGISPDQYGLFPEDDAEPEEATGLVPPAPQLAPEPVSAPDPAAPQEELQLPPVEEPATDNSRGNPLNKYTCMDCRLQCYSQDELRLHRKIHQDPTWWKCTHCRNFVKHREMHLLKKHPSISESELESSFMLRYRCWMCRMYFKSLHQMEVHANIKHQVPLPDDHQQAPPVDELEEGEIRSNVPMGAPVPPMMPSLPAMALPGLPQPLTVQPPLPIVPEHFPLLLSQLENGALDYLREFSRLMDPNNQLGLAGQLNIKSEPVDTSQSAMDLSGSSALNVNVGSSATDLHSTRDDTTATEHEDDNDGDDESEDDTFFRLDNRTYQCKFCPEIFRHLQQIRKHTKVQHPSEWKSFKCVHCKRRFPSGPMRDRHVHFHSLNHPFKCTECDQMYRSKKRLEKHFEVFHDRTSHNFSMERFHCGSCDLTFVEKKYYDLHARIYHERKPQRLKNLSDKIQVCERCVKTFDSRELLMEHIRETHQGDPPLKSCICQTCSKDLKTVTLLRIHILVVHMGIMPFVCQHCNAEFSTRHWLLKHLEKEHSEIALYKCPSCDESFTTESRMTEHKDKVHAQLEIEFDPQSGKSVYPCGKCEKKLESKDVLDKHLLKAHPSFMLMYKCPLCPQSVRYRKQHMRVHHDVEYDAKEHHYQVRYKCHCCSKLFQQKRNLLSHQNSLSNQCSRCQMRFKTKKNLQAHMAAHRTNKSLKCEDCGLDFGYRGRLEEHRKRYHSATSTQVLKIINCPYCPKLFISPSNRERHIAANHVQSEFKVNCGHCPVQVTDTTQLRKHYKTVHPEERVTFKCPGCEKFYLNLSSFKDHYKKHKKGDGEDDKEEMNSTTEAVEDGEKEANDQNVGGALESILIKEETNVLSGNATNPRESAAKGIEDNAMNVGEPSEQEIKVEIKQEPLENGEAATSKDLAEGEKLIVAEETNETKSAVLDEQKIDFVEAKEECQESIVEAVTAEQPGPSVEHQAATEETTAKEKPVWLTAEELKQEEKMVVEETAETKPEEPVAFEGPDERMVVDEPTAEEHVKVEETVHLSTNESTATVQPKQDIPQENVSVVEEKSTLEKPTSDEKMEVDEMAEETPCKSTSEVQQQESTSDHDVSVVKKEHPEENPTTEEEIDSKPAEEVKPEQESSSESVSPEEQTSAVKEPKPNDTTMDEVATEELKVTVDGEITSKPAEEVNSDQETSSASSAVEEPKPNETTMVEETTEELKSEPETGQVLLKPEEKTTVEETTTPDESVNKSETAEVKPEQDIALENVVLSENPSLSDAPLVESCSSKKENSERVDPSITEKMDQEGVENEERMVQQDDETNKEKEGETAEEPPVEKRLEECLPECSNVDENPEEASLLSEHSESKQENAVDEILPKDVANESEKSHPAEEEQEQKLESPAAVDEPQEPSPEDPASSVQNSRDDPPLEDLRSVNNSPASTLVESPYTIVESSNEASEVSESSAVSERSTKTKIAGERRRISTRNILKRKKKLVVLLEPVDIDKLMELSRGSSSSSSPSLEKVAMKGSGGSSSESQPVEDGVRAKRLRRERQTPTSDTVAGDS